MGEGVKLKIKNVMVFNVAAENVGALSILHDFHRDIAERAKNDKKWFFVLGRAELSESENVRVLRFPWVKKSWLHRFFFDWFVAPGLVKKHGIDEVLSLQNLTVPRVNLPQTVYLHQSLPFSGHRFSFFKEPLFWTYQNIIGPMIMRSIKKADTVIVQTEWMKKACVEKACVCEKKIQVTPPKITSRPIDFFKPNKETFSTFFYPASALSYKNHTVILEACNTLLKQGGKKFRVIFTMHGNENKYAKNLKKQVQNERLPIEFTGSLTREEVFEQYTRSVLLFPSYIETFGLPLLEARIHKSVILASDCSFSREILEGYKNVHFFNPFDAERLSDLMSTSINLTMPYISFNYNQD